MYKFIYFLYYLGNTQQGRDIWNRVSDHYISSINNFHLDVPEMLTVSTWSDLCLKVEKFCSIEVKRQREKRSNIYNKMRNA